MTSKPDPVNARIRPTLQTPFHIDYEWWNRDGQDLRVYLISQLPLEQQAGFAARSAEETIDWVDPETAEVRRVDSLQIALQQAATQDDFITPNTSLVDAVFRILLVNGNRPMTPMEMGEQTGRSPQTILKTLSGRQVYRGIRPLTD